jgi:hypothetical protein
MLASFLYVSLLLSTFTATCLGLCRLCGLSPPFFGINEWPAASILHIPYLSHWHRNIVSRHTSVTASPRLLDNHATTLRHIGRFRAHSLSFIKQTMWTTSRIRQHLSSPCLATLSNIYIIVSTLILVSRTCFSIGLFTITPQNVTFTQCSLVKTGHCCLWLRHRPHLALAVLFHANRVCALPLGSLASYYAFCYLPLLHILMAFSSLPLLPSSQGHMPA